MAVLGTEPLATLPLSGVRKPLAPVPGALPTPLTPGLPSLPPPTGGPLPGQPTGIAPLPLPAPIGAPGGITATPLPPVLMNPGATPESGITAKPLPPPIPMNPLDGGAIAKPLPPPIQAAPDLGYQPVAIPPPINVAPPTSGGITAIPLPPPLTMPNNVPSGITPVTLPPPTQAPPWADIGFNDPKAPPSDPTRFPGATPKQPIPVQLPTGPGYQPIPLPPPIGAPPPTGGPLPTGPSTFGPDQNLIGTQFAPSTDHRLGGTQGMVNSAAQNLAQGPDLRAAGLDVYNSLLDQALPSVQAAGRSILQNAAAGGRLGSGMTQEQLTSDPFGASGLGVQFNKYRTQLAQQLAGSLAPAEDQQRLATLSALSGLEGQQYGQGVTGREELRGERGYQQGLDQQALQNQALLAQLQDSLTNSAFGRGATQLSLLNQIGNQGNPSGVEQAYADLLNNQGNAALGSGSDLLQQLIQNMARRNNPGGMIPDTTSGLPLGTLPPLP